MGEINKQGPENEVGDSVSSNNQPSLTLQSTLESTNASLLETVDSFDVQKIFTSEQFTNELKQVDEKIRSEAIGKVLEYAILHPDGFEFWEFVQALKNTSPNGSEYELDEHVRKLFTESVVRKLNINDDGSMDSKTKFIDYCVEHLVKNGIYFHGFNGIFEKQIREQGLTPDERQWDWNELRRIHEICVKGGHTMVLGWGFLNCEGKISLSENARSTYRYATVSPEWYAQFTCEGFHIPVEGGRKTAFYRRDHQTARSNVELLCNEMMSRKQDEIDAGKAPPNITADEKNKILAFFEKYWQKLAGDDSKPKVALVKQKATTENSDEFDRNVQRYRDEGLVENAHDMTLTDIMGVFFSKFGSDIQIAKAIPAENLMIIDLPDYPTIFPER